MAIIEKLLLKQLEESINRKQDTSCSKMLQIDDCKSLKDMIEKMMPKNGEAVAPIIKEKLYQLINVMTEWHILMEVPHPLAPEAMMTANNLRGKIKQIRKDVENAGEKGGIPVQRPGESYRWSSRSVDPTKIYGVEDKDMIMESLLVKEGFKAIGIVGMTGIGKTALCQKVFSNQQVKKHFLPRIWVCLSKQPNVPDYKKELVKMILMSLGFQKEILKKVVERDLDLFALKQQLKRQRYLIVLDDVWNVDEHFKVFCSSLTEGELPKAHGGAVVVTTRSPSMIEKMVGEKNLHSLPLADKESCWKIFKDEVEKDGIVLTEGTRKTGDKIKEKCAGLPLIAKMLGQIEHMKPKDKKKEPESQVQEEKDEKK